MNGEKRSGFTLIEVLIVVAILSIIASICIIPILKSNQRTLLLDTTNQLVVELQKARIQAIENTFNITFNYAKGGNLYFINDKEYSLPTGIKFDEQEDISFTFYPNGTVSSGQIKLQSGYYYTNIIILPMRGKIVASQIMVDERLKNEELNQMHHTYYPNDYDQSYLRGRRY